MYTNVLIPLVLYFRLKYFFINYNLFILFKRSLRYLHDFYFAIILIQFNVIIQALKNNVNRITYLFLYLKSFNIFIFSFLKFKCH